MGDKLKTMGPNGDPDSVSEVSQKVASFYRKLQSAPCGSLAKLHMSSLKAKSIGKNCDYVVTLTEMGKEQKFEVTYVEVEEKNDEDQIQCLVQLSTLPVAVCYGVGNETKTANNDAARNALNYLKMMTKRTVQEKKQIRWNINIKKPLTHVYCIPSKLFVALDAGDYI